MKQTFLYAVCGVILVTAFSGCAGINSLLKSGCPGRLMSGCKYRLARACSSTTPLQKSPDENNKKRRVFLHLFKCHKNARHGISQQDRCRGFWVCTQYQIATQRKRLWFGIEEQQNERAMSFTMKWKSSSQAIWRLRRAVYGCRKRYICLR